MPSKKRTSEKRPPDEAPAPSLPTHRADGFATFYTNFAKVTSAFYDLSIIFGETATAPDGKRAVEEKCRIVMNPAQAKVLALALALNIKKWESQFWEISIPAEMVRRLEAVHAALAKGARSRKREG